MKNILYQLLSLHHSLNDKTCSQSQLEDKLKMTHRLIKSIENEKLTLHEELEHCRQY